MTLKKRILTLGIFSFMLSGIMFCSLINGIIDWPEAAQTLNVTNTGLFWGNSGFGDVINENEKEKESLKNRIDKTDASYNRTKAVQSKQKLIDIATEANIAASGKVTLSGSILTYGPNSEVYDCRSQYFETYAEKISHYGSSSSTTSSSTSSSSSSQSSSNSTTSQATATNTNTNASANTNTGTSTTTTANQNVITLDLHGGSMKGDSVIAGVNTTYEVLVSDIQYVTLASYTQDLVPPEGYHFMSWAVENGNPVSEFSTSLAGKTIYAVWADDVTSVIMGGYPWSLY